MSVDSGGGHVVEVFEGDEAMSSRFAELPIASFLPWTRAAGGALGAWT